MSRNTAWTATQDNGQHTPGTATARVVFPATAINTAFFSEFNVGFRPRYVQFVNLTDRTTIEYYDGMAANTCLKTAAAGTRTLETVNGGITLTNTGFFVSQNATLAAILASKDCQFLAVG